MPNNSIHTTFIIAWPEDGPNWFGEEATLDKALEFAKRMAKANNKTAVVYARRIQTTYHIMNYVGPR